SAVRFPNAPGGPMRLRAPNGVLFGKASIEPHHTRVPLTAAGRRALARHAMVVITFLHVTWRTRL
ncbi:MAG: hypothetical protein QOI80_3477, partial [Solirubrobacteraceae bacterium]|nr:hypothetical protein [Solirubrobacteraceae bacterium]